MKRPFLLVLLAGSLAGLSVSGPVGAESPARTAHAAATCSQYANQAAAQAAADTRDADGDGIYCESLPCPCSTGSGSSGGSTPKPAPAPPKKTCTLTGKVQDVVFSAAKYPHIRSHFLAAVKAGWPRILVINRPYADSRRDKLLADVPTKKGYDRDEYPPAMGRGKYRKALERGTNPRGWMADVAYVGSSENRSHGSSMGSKLRSFCNGQQFRYRFN